MGACEKRVANADDTTKSKAVGKGFVMLTENKQVQNRTFYTLKDMPNTSLYVLHFYHFITFFIPAHLSLLMKYIIFMLK